MRIRFKKVKNWEIVCIAKSGDIDHLNPVESDHLLSGAN
jgi:hypothetical protein